MGKLKVTFHNPNTEDETADFLLKIFIEANMSKLEEELKKTSMAVEEKEEKENIHKIS